MLKAFHSIDELERVPCFRGGVAQTLCLHESRESMAPRVAPGISFRRGRRGFTLLEMVLALLIGVVLMYSLYSVLNQQVRQAQQGRLILHEATLARSLLTRMAGDILCTLGAANPRPTASGGGGGTGATSNSAAASTTTGTSTDSTIVFNNGVYGTNNMLVLTVSKVPRDLNLTQVLGTSVASADPTQQSTISDLARISYWMVGGGQNSPSQSAGLARQELQQATSNEIATLPPDVDPSTYKLIPEVKDIQFQYFDGVNWNDTWDGTTLGGPTGEIPIGPPAAIKITLTFFRRDVNNNDLPDSALPPYQHVVCIPAGNNFPMTNP